MKYQYRFRPLNQVEDVHHLLRLLDEFHQGRCTDIVQVGMVCGHFGVLYRVEVKDEA